MEGRRFKFFQYNLSENLLNPDPSCTLRHYMIALNILNEFKDQKVWKRLIDIQIPYQRNDFEVANEVKAEWEKILTIVSDKVSKYPVALTLVEDLKNTVPLLGSQIYNLFWKMESHEERCLYFHYLVLNITGDINARQTVCKILRECKNSDHWKFLFSCKHYANEDTVTKYFHLLPKPVKIWYARTTHSNCTELCIPVCFWLWHISRTKNVFEDYVQESPMNRGRFIFDENYETDAVKFAFHLAFIKGNESAVQFIYDNYISVSDEKNLILEQELQHGTELNFGFIFTNIIIYLISKVEQNLPSWFLEWSVYIFDILFRDFRWHNIFVEGFRDTQDQFLEESIAILQTCIDVLSKKNESDYASIYRNSLESFVNALSPTTRTFISITNEEIYYSIVKSVLENNMNEKITKILLNIANGVKTHKRETFMEMDANKNSMWVVQISNCSTEFMDSVFNEFLGKEEGSKMRQWIFDTYGYDAILYFIANYQFDHLETFLSWTSSCYDELSLKNEKHKITKYFFNLMIRRILFCEDIFPLSLFFETRKEKTNIEYKDCTINYTNKVLKWVLIDDRNVSRYKESMKKELSNSFYPSLKKWVVDLKFKEIGKLFKFCNLSKSSISEIKEMMWSDRGLHVDFCKDVSHTNIMEFAEWYYSTTPYSEILKKSLAKMRKTHRN